MQASSSATNAKLKTTKASIKAAPSSSLASNKKLVSAPALEDQTSEIEEISKKISEHAECIYREWRSKGLAPEKLLDLYSNGSAETSAVAVDIFNTSAIKSESSSVIETQVPLQNPEGLQKFVNNFVLKDKEQRGVKSIKSGNTLVLNKNVLEQTKKLNSKATLNARGTTTTSEPIKSTAALVASTPSKSSSSSPLITTKSAIIMKPAVDHLVEASPKKKASTSTATSLSSTRSSVTPSVSSSPALTTKKTIKQLTNTTTSGNTMSKTTSLTSPVSEKSTTIQTPATVSTTIPTASTSILTLTNNSSVKKFEIGSHENEINNKIQTKFTKNCTNISNNRSTSTTTPIATATTSTSTSTTAATATGISLNQKQQKTSTSTSATPSLISASNSSLSSPTPQKSNIKNSSIQSSNKPNINVNINLDFDVNLDVKNLAEIQNMNLQNIKALLEKEAKESKSTLKQPVKIQELKENNHAQNPRTATRSTSPLKTSVISPPVSSTSSSNINNNCLQNNDKVSTKSLSMTKSTKASTKTRSSSPTHQKQTPPGTPERTSPTISENGLDIVDMLKTTNSAKENINKCEGNSTHKDTLTMINNNNNNVVSLTKGKSAKVNSSPSDKTSASRSKDSNDVMLSTSDNLATSNNSTPSITTSLATLSSKISQSTETDSSIINKINETSGENLLQKILKEEKELQEKSQKNHSAKEISTGGKSKKIKGKDLETEDTSSTRSPLATIETNLISISTSNSSATNPITSAKHKRLNSSSTTSTSVSADSGMEIARTTMPTPTKFKSGRTALSNGQDKNIGRPILTRGSVAERVLMFEKCPDVRNAFLNIKRPQNDDPPKSLLKVKLHATPPPPPQETNSLQKEIRSSKSVYIPRFYFPHGKPQPQIAQERVSRGILGLFDSFPNNQVTKDELPQILKLCGIPYYWRMPIILFCTQNANPSTQTTGLVERQRFLEFWRQMGVYCHDAASRFIYILSKGQRCRQYIEPDDLIPLVQDVVDTHPGLAFLKEATEFHSRYVHTVISRIFYSVNRSWSGKITIAELKKSDLLEMIQLLEEEDDINQIMAFFSYEHFYVIYCKFWELDQDHDLLINQDDLARHSDHALSTRIVERIFSGCVTRQTNKRSVEEEPKMSYTDFVWFLLSEEDKRTPTAIEYWFRCMDIDGDGVLSMYELEYFYEEQQQRMESIGIETLPFEDCLCQMLDMIKPARRDCITLGDLKRCKMTHVFFDTFFNLEKYLDHEQRDPFATQRDEFSSDWDRFAAQEYELLISEENE